MYVYIYIVLCCVCVLPLTSVGKSWWFPYPWWAAWWDLSLENYSSPSFLGKTPCLNTVDGQAKSCTTLHGWKPINYKSEGTIPLNDCVAFSDPAFSPRTAFSFKLEGSDTSQSISMRCLHVWPNFNFAGEAHTTCNPLHTIQLRGWLSTPSLRTWRISWQLCRKRERALCAAWFN